MNQPLISVVVPIYNTEKYLKKCIESIKQQTYKQIEILLVDDGSTDKSAEYCKELAKETSNIFYFYKENGGSSSARNFGIKKAKGDFIGFVDSDDFISPTMYETLVNAAINGKYEIVQGARDEVDEDGNELPDVCQVVPKETFVKSEQFLEDLLMHKGDCSFCTKLIKRHLLWKHNFPEGKLNEDFFLMLQLLREVEGVYVVPEKFYHVCYRIGSNTRTKDKNYFPSVFLDIVENSDYALQLVRQQYPLLEKQGLRFSFYQRLEYMLHIPISMMKKENKFYEKVKQYLRRNIGKMIRNPYLTKKEKVYLCLLTIAPRWVRQFHCFLKGNML